jgi:ribonuclease HI
MEIKAVIEGLRYFLFEMNKFGEKVTVISDSSYVVKAIDLCIDKCEQNQLITYENKPVKNKSLWQEIYKKCRIKGRNIVKQINYFPDIGEKNTFYNNFKKDNEY